MKFFLDNQLSPHLAVCLHSLASPYGGHDVVHLRSKFTANTKDVEWITTLGDEGGWILLCGDLNILRTQAEKKAYKAAGLVGFFLKKGWINLAPFDQAWRLVKW